MNYPNFKHTISKFYGEQKDQDNENNWNDQTDEGEQHIEKNQTDQEEQDSEEKQAVKTIRGRTKQNRK